MERERFIREEAVAEERRKQEHEIRHLQERLIQQRTLKTLQPQGSNLPQLQTTSTPSFPIPQSRVPVSPQANSIQVGRKLLFKLFPIFLLCIYIFERGEEIIILSEQE